MNLALLGVFLGGSCSTSNTPAVKDFINTADRELGSVTHAL